MRFGQQPLKHLRMLLIKLIKLEVALSVLELPIKEKQQSYGIRKQENQFTMQ